MNKTKKKKTVLWSILTPILIFILYTVVCGSVFLVDMAKMGKVNETATDKQAGLDRLESTENPAEVFTLSTGAVLTYFPCGNGKEKPFILICPGGGYTTCETVGEGYTVGAEINRAGYDSFILTYRTGKNSSYHAPLSDVAEALRFIWESGNFSVSDRYALCGFSAGGNLIGLFGTEKWGYKNYDLPKPELLIMGYPWLTQTSNGKGNLVYDIYYTVLNGKGRKAFLGEKYTEEEEKSMDAVQWVDDNYPSCYIVHGTADTVVPVETSRKMASALKEKNIACALIEYEGLRHGFGIGKGTSAEGWITRSLDFWETHGN